MFTSSYIYAFGPTATFRLNIFQGLQQSLVHHRYKLFQVPIACPVGEGYAWGWPESYHIDVSQMKSHVQIQENILTLPHSRQEGAQRRWRHQTCWSSPKEVEAPFEQQATGQQMPGYEG